MKLQIMSDLHLEWWNFREAFFSRLPIVGDILILAGDIDGKSEIINTLERFASMFKTVIYVPGNHEYYGGSLDEVDNLLATNKKEQFNNLFILNNRYICRTDECEESCRTFIGSTMWIPEQPDSIYYESSVTDFSIINGARPDIYDKNRKCQEFLRENIDKDSIIVTHHAPSPLSISKKYIGNLLNKFYVCDMTNLIIEREPKLWVHGHMHQNFDYMIGNTRVICNPLGYAAMMENPHFAQDFVIEI